MKSWRTRIHMFHQEKRTHFEKSLIKMDSSFLMLYSVQTCTITSTLYFKSTAEPMVRNRILGKVSSPSDTLIGPDKKS